MPPRRCGRPDVSEPSLRARALLLPLTIVLTVTTAIALLATALTLFPPPAPPIMAAPSAAHAARAAVPPSALAGALARNAPIALPPPPLVLAMARLTYRPGATGIRQTMPGPLLLVVEAGALVVRLETPGRLHWAGDADPSALGDCLGACRLGVGDSVLLPAGTPAAIANGGSAPAVVVAAAVLPAAMTSAGFGRAAQRRWDAAWSPGASVTPLAGGWAAGLAASAARLTLERRTLGPGVETALAGGGVQALAVETGALTLTAEQGRVWRQQPAQPDAWLGPGTAATVLVGESALVQAGGRLRLRNDGSGPLQLLVLTIVPDAGTRDVVGPPPTRADAGMARPPYNGAGPRQLLVPTADPATVGGRVDAESTRADARLCASRRGTSRWTVDCATEAAGNEPE